MTKGNGFAWGFVYSVTKNINYAIQKRHQLV